MTKPDPIDALIPPAPAADTSPAPRPTTRAGRRAVTEANKVKAKAAGKPAPTRTRKASLETRLAGSITTLGVGVATAGAIAGPAYVADGQLIITQAPDIAAALDGLAQNDPRIKASLERMLTVGTYGALAAALIPLAVGIAANHGLLPADLAAAAGIEPPAPTPEPAPAAAAASTPTPPTGLT